MSFHHNHFGCCEVVDDHHHAVNFNRAFIIGTTLNVGFVIIEAVFGFLTNSLALLADAGHNFSDVLGLLLAWGASWLVNRRCTPRYTYGFRRSSIFAPLFNSILLFIALVVITIEAISRLANPVAISETTIIGVALVGVVINGITAFLFMSGREKDLNIKGAFLHMAADAVISLGVVLAGIGMMVTGWLWFDSVVSLIIVVMISLGTWNLLKESVHLALDGVPSGINVLAVRTYLRELPGVVEVHDLHIWAMSTTEPILTAHLVMPIGNSGDGFLLRINQDLNRKFGIKHTTIQIETGNCLTSCPQKYFCD